MDQSTNFLASKLGYFFRILDLNGNGVLQVDDFGEMTDKVKKIMNYEDGSKEHVRASEKSLKFFKSLTRDIKPFSFNQITEQEWINFFLTSVIPDEEAVNDYKELVFNFMFDFFDQNRDGFISYKEYSDFFTIFGINPTYLKESFDKLSSSQGRVSRYELMAAVEEFFTSEDESLDGNWVFGNWESAAHTTT